MREVLKHPGIHRVEIVVITLYVHKITILSQKDIFSQIKSFFTGFLQFPFRLLTVCAKERHRDVKAETRQCPPPEIIFRGL